MTALAQLGEDGGLGLAFADVGEVVEDEQAVFVELFNGGGQAQSLAGGLELLDEVGGAGEQDTVPGLDQCVAKRGAQVRLADAGRHEQENVSAAVQPAVTGGERVDAGETDHRGGGEVDGVDRNTGKGDLDDMGVGHWHPVRIDRRRARDELYPVTVRRTFHAGRAVHDFASTSAGKRAR